MNQIDGWTVTKETAIKRAGDWFKIMVEEGFTDVELLEDIEYCSPVDEEVVERWSFTFRHRITGVEVELLMHGIDNIHDYVQFFPLPDVYWNGVSDLDPRLEDFAAPGFVPVMTYRKAD
jgi:hypothetical protein